MKVEAKRSVDSHLGVKVEHPSFGTISAHRVSGRMNLFGSKVGHDGFVKISIHEAHLYEDGHHDRILPGSRVLIEVALSEAQWVGFISRMNMGSGTPCTLSLRPVGYTLERHECPDDESAVERMTRAVDQIKSEMDKNIDERAEALRSLATALPKRKAEEFNRSLDILVQNLRSHADYGHKTLTERKETLVAEAKVELDAMIQSRVMDLGITSLQQLAGPTSDPE